MPPMASSFYELGFSSNLLTTVENCREKVEQWAEREKAKADEMEAAYSQTLSGEQSKVDSLVSELLALQFQLGVTVKNPNHNDSDQKQGIAQRQQALQKRREDILKEIENLKEQHESRNQRVKELQTKEAEENARAEKVRQQKLMAEESKTMTIENLTKGMVNYKYLCLDFEKAEEGRLRFSFTSIDPKDPSRQFSFLLSADEMNTYHVEDCQPTIDQNTLETLLADVDQTDDLQSFIIGMRKAFAGTI